MLEKIPSILTETKFNNNGLVETDSGVLIPAYIASQYGFSDFGRKNLLNFNKEALKENIFPLCPFTACSEYLDFSKLANESTLEEAETFWNDFNSIVGPVNYGELMPRSKMLVAKLNGLQLDDGVAAEIGFYRAKFDNQIFAINTDRRLNIRSSISYLIDGIFGSTNEFLYRVKGYSNGKKNRDVDSQVNAYDGVPAIIFSQFGYDLDESKIMNEYINSLSDIGISPIRTFDYKDISPDIVYNKLMDDAKIAIAFFDGSHASNDEVCAQVGYFAASGKPIIGIRSDFRLAENLAAPINPAVRYFIDQNNSEGKFFCGFDAYDKAFDHIADFVKNQKK